MKAIKTKAGNEYSREQVQEAIAVWESRLRKLDEVGGPTDTAAYQMAMATWKELKQFVAKGGTKYAIYAANSDGDFKGYVRLKDVRLDGKKLVFEAEMKDGKPVLTASALPDSVDSLVAACGGCKARDIFPIEIQAADSFKTKLTYPSLHNSVFEFRFDAEFADGDFFAGL